jgi:long-chain acyl-CoA synthetase
MASSYRDRPWLQLYQPGKPADISPEHSDALSMWRSGLSRNGDRPFMYYFDTPVTAGTVESDSDALAAAFAARGLGHGDRVALFLQNVPQFVIGLLAAWKIGGIAVPVNPMLKERELNYVLRDCGARAIVSLQDLWNSVASKAVAGTAVETAITTGPFGYLGDLGGQDLPSPLKGLSRLTTPGAIDLAELVRDHRGDRPDPVAAGPSDVALLTYTSGTTGEPKAAMNTHGNITFNAAAFREWMSLTPDDIVLAGAPLFHITGLIAHIAVAMLVPMPMVLGYRFEPAAINRQRPFDSRLRPLVADQGVQRGRPDRAQHRRAVRARSRAVHPQHLRADRDDLAIARGADGPPGAGRPGERCAVGGSSRLQHRRPDRRR